MSFAVLRVSILRKILMVAACVLVCAWFQTSIALAQHGGRVGGGGHFRTGVRVGTPHVVAAPASRAMFLPLRGGFPERSPLIFRPSFFIRARFLNFREGFDSSWWLYCGPIWGWKFGCDDFFLSEYAFEHYLAPPLTYASPVYVYSLDGRQLVQLYLKDGTAYDVNDYWFVDNQIHFTMRDESGTKSVEQAIGLEELDLQRTIDVNTRRGFRVVMRNEPMEQYLRDHPDLTPPLVKLPQ